MQHRMWVSILKKILRASQFVFSQSMLCAAHRYCVPHINKSVAMGSLNY